MKLTPSLSLNAATNSTHAQRPTRVGTSLRIQARRDELTPREREVL